MSVNQAWQGKRFKTKEYSKYQNDLLFLLPKNLVIPPPPLKISFVFGVSSPLSDWDNPIKPCQDIICAKYGLNDKHIFKGTAEKVLVKQGNEFIKFKIESM